LGGYRAPITHGNLGAAAERFDPKQLRRGLVWIGRRFKRGKVFEESKVHGLLVVSLDAKEQLCGDHRCCEDCLIREVTCKGPEPPIAMGINRCTDPRSTPPCETGFCCLHLHPDAHLR
jgi:hypothetical protein